MQDLISVIIPTYNGEKYIRECIESIQSQDFPHEIIVSRQKHWYSRS